MRLQELLRPSDILCGFDAPDKWGVLDRLMEHLRGTTRYPAELQQKLHEAVHARERSMSTGMEHGIAIPHAAVEGLDEIVACMAILPEGVNFESIDASPTQFCVLLLIPPREKLLHIRTLAEVAKVLGKEPVRQALLQASDSDEAWHALVEAG
jgi:mannitol/fructose-specific phosphotransferase system IIA component (Ntr-type)